LVMMYREKERTTSRDRGGFFLYYFGDLFTLISFGKTI
jgi:hypothetical protein